MRGLFVTGTGTNIGKTITSAALLCRYRATGPLRYWKPVQTGIPEDDDTATVRDLASCADEEICGSGVRLPRPLSPHLSARLSGVKIAIPEVMKLARPLDADRRSIVEGAGGVLVPLNASEFMADLIVALALPALVVASSQLGTINHTLLTLEALRKRSIPVAGVILVGELNPENRRDIETFGDVPVVGEMPPFDPLTPAALSHWSTRELDCGGQLERFFA
jgi:dethiobiotin synthetase